MKKSFTLLEIILCILLLSIISSFFIPKLNKSRIDEVTNMLVLYLKQTRYLSLVDNKYKEDDTLWFKKRWTLKFFRCRESVGGLYYSIYSDKNNSGHVSSEDSLKDPLTNKNIYSSNYCEEREENSKYVLLTKQYKIIDINVSCNKTSSLGQISFGNDGNIYTKLSNQENEESEYLLDEECIITLKDSFNEERRIKLNPISAYINKITY
jgi:hypothetical protein